MCSFHMDRNWRPNCMSLFSCWKNLSMGPNKTDLGRPRPEFRNFIYIFWTVLTGLLKTTVSLLRKKIYHRDRHEFATGLIPWSGLTLLKKERNGHLLTHYRKKTEHTWKHWEGWSRFWILAFLRLDWGCWWTDVSRSFQSCLIGSQVTALGWLLKPRVLFTPVFSSAVRLELLSHWKVNHRASWRALATPELWGVPLQKITPTAGRWPHQASLKGRSWGGAASQHDA